MIDINRATLNNVMNQQSQAAQAPEPTSGRADGASALSRAAAERNAAAAIQARYGGKQKEGRPVKKALDKDDFMRIMITEMKHQDPTKPMDADRMATQMAQITSVEQLKNVSTSLDKLAEKSSASDRLAMSMMIGKTVTVDKGRFNHQKGTLSPISFDLPEAADKIKLTVLDEHGEEVATRELEPMQQGPNSYNWDGINSSSLQAPSATYTVRIDAENKSGGKIKINPIAKETVVGVSFEGGEANFLVGSGKNLQKVGMKSITRLEGDSPRVFPAHPERMGATASANDETIHAKPASPDNGEFPLPENVKAKLGLNTPEGEAALKASQEQLAKAENEEKESRPIERGFPNGLKE